MVAVEDERNRRSRLSRATWSAPVIRISAVALRCARERESDRFTIYDGWIPEPGAEIDPTAPEGPAVSASQLETLGQCPLKYFFRYVLKIGPPEELTTRPGSLARPARADRSCTRCSSSSSRN